MNGIITYFVISTMCIFGTKLSMTNSEFTEFLPGKASADLVTKFKLDIRSNGKKNIVIEAIWVKNKKATWKIIDADNNEIASINDKKTYTLKGDVKTSQGKTKSKTVEALANYEEEFVMVYKVGNSKNVKFLKIDKIADLKQIRKQ